MLSFKVIEWNLRVEGLFSEIFWKICIYSCHKLPFKEVEDNYKIESIVQSFKVIEWKLRVEAGELTLLKKIWKICIPIFIWRKLPV